MAEKGTKPSDEMAWASAAAAGDVTSPSSGQEASGYQFAQVLPHDEFNYLLKNTTDWISYIQEGRPRTFTDLGSACSTLSAGDTALVLGEGDVSKPWLDKLVSRASSTGSTNADAMAVDSEHVYIGHVGLVRILDRITMSTVATITFSGTASALYSDGDYLFVGTSGTANAVQAWDWKANSIVWTHNHGDSVRAVYANGDYCYFVGDYNTTSHGAALDRGTGAVINSISLNSGDAATQGRDVISDGTKVWVASSGGTTPDDLHIYTADGTYVSGASHSLDTYSLALGSTSVFLGHEDGTVRCLSKRSPGVQRWLTSPLWTGECFSAAFCYDYLAVGGGDSGSASTPSLALLDPSTGELIETYDHGIDFGGVNYVVIHSVVSDGMGLFCGGREDSSGDFAWRHNLQRTATTAQIMDAASARYMWAPTHTKALLGFPFKG